MAEPIDRHDLPKQWVLVLDEYQAVNLAAVLAEINDEATELGSSRFNTGDWVNEIRWKLPELYQGMKPNQIRPPDYDSVGRRHRRHRRLDDG